MKKVDSQKKNSKILVFISLFLLNFFIFCSGSESQTSDGDISQDLNDTYSVETVTPTNSITKQEAISTDDFSNLVKNDEKLAAVYNYMKGVSSGAVNIDYAGVLENENGDVLTFGSYVDDAGAKRVILKYDSGESTVYAMAMVVNEKCEFYDSSGNKLDPIKVGSPTLLKELPGLDLSEDTKLVYTGLKYDEFPVYDITKRNFIIANAFGDTFLYTFSDLKDLAASVDMFNNITENDYVTKEEIMEYLKQLKVGDIFIWVGHGVRMKATSTGIYKTVAMTANRGIFGDEAININDIKEALKSNPFKNLGGASIIFLAGSQSFSDGNLDKLFPESVAKNLENSNTVVIGYSGSINSAAMKKNMKTFFDCIFEGTDLNSCVDEANKELKAMGFKSKLMVHKMNENFEYELPLNLSNFWGQTPIGKKPKAIHLSLKLGVQNKCIDKNNPSNKYTQEQTEYAQSLFVKDLTFDDSPVFHGERHDDGGPVNVTLKGFFSNLKKGSYFIFYVEGDVSETMKSIKIYCLAHVVDIEDKGDKIRVKFDGNATASEYINNLGDKCMLNLDENSIKAMTSTTSEPSFFEFEK